jgi:transposase
MDSLIFIQDNALIHIVTKVKEWFKDNGVYTTDWPPFSPDLNPIEYVWKALKERVNIMYPELWNSTGESGAELDALEEALCKAWEALPDSLFESLISSMGRRIKACIEADGWHTKY